MSGRRPHALITAIGFLFLLQAGACSVLDPSGTVEVRVRNATSLTFDEGILYLVGDSILFPALAPGQATPYRAVETAYRYATTQVVTGSDTARLQVIDYVGETPLKGGRYTFVLSFFEGNPTSLVQELDRDR